MILNIGGGGGVKPRIVVTAPTGSDVTVSKGSTILYAPEVSGTWTFNVPEQGDWSATAILGSKTASKTVSVSKVGVYNVTLRYVSATLNDNSWEDIKGIADASEGQNYWAVGDTKQIIMRGNVGEDLILSNYQTWVYIIGFDHNSDVEGTGIAFGGFKTAQTGGKDVALVDTYYGDNPSAGKRFNMNNNGTTYGGWASCDMRNNIMPLAKAALPSDLRTVIKTTTIYSDNTGGGGPGVASHVTATTDDIYLLAEFEVFGVRTYANSAEQNYQQQYAYYSAGNSKIKYRHNSPETTAIWWERSVYATRTNSFCYVGTAGNSSAANANDSYGLALAFKVGTTPIFPTLNDNSWSAIAKVAYTSEGANYWSVGDTKQITINGKLSDGLTLSNYKTWVYILGFDHNEAVEGKGIVFGGFKTAQTGGKDVALCDSGYGQDQTTGQYFNMNNNSTIGGWQSCNMRNIILPMVRAALPGDLISAIKMSTIYTDNTGGTSTAASYVTATQDDLYLLSEWEVFGAHTYANIAEQNYQQQYEYYSAGNSKVKHSHANIGSAVFWWGRSVVAGSIGKFCQVSNSGTSVSVNSLRSNGLAPAFRVCYTPPQPISNLSVGDIVKVKESGTDVDYIIIQQGNPDATMYDASCDGAWLLRKDVVRQSQWNSTGVNSYSGSTIDIYLNSTFINTTNISDIIKEVKIPYRTIGKYGRNYSLENGLSTKVFLLSGSEVNTALATYMSIEGAHLGYFSDNTSRLAYYNGDVKFWWLRSPYTNDEGYVWGVDAIGGFGRDVAQEGSSRWVRPAFIIPSNTLIDSSGNIVLE